MDPKSSTDRGTGLRVSSPKFLFNFNVRKSCYFWKVTTLKSVIILYSGTLCPPRPEITRPPWGWVTGCIKSEDSYWSVSSRLSTVQPGGVSPRLKTWTDRLERFLQWTWRLGYLTNNAPKMFCEAEDWQLMTFVIYWHINLSRSAALISAYHQARSNLCPV